MNKIIIAAAVSAMFAASAFAQTGTAVTSGGFTNGNVGNTISGSVTAVNGGFSESQATNSQSITASLTSSVSKGTSSIAGQNVPTQTAGISAVIGDSSSSTAWNSSTGNANGNASSAGGNGVVAGGSNEIPAIVTSNKYTAGDTTGSGYAGLGSTDNIVANTNQGGYTGSIGSANFGSTQTYTNVPVSTTGGESAPVSTGSIGVSSVLTGDATVSNSSGVMTVNTVALQAPTTLSIGNSGTFTAAGAGATGINVSTNVPLTNEGGNVSTHD